MINKKLREMDSNSAKPLFKIVKNVSKTQLLCCVPKQTVSTDGECQYIIMLLWLYMVIVLLLT